MKSNLQLSATVLVVMAGALQTTYGENAVDTLRPLVESSARRLVLAEQVALAKWDSHTPVEDSVRERQVIASAVSQGEAKDLNGTFIETFFRAQIEANKLVQYSRLADWYRNNGAPTHAPVDLKRSVRTELDRVQAALITALRDTSAIRATASCRADMAIAAGRYVAANKKRIGQLEAVALDRALADACTH